MIYQVLLSEYEERVLVGLIGQPLHEVRSDRGFSAELRVGNDIIEGIPEEFHTPSETHPDAEVERPNFAAVECASDHRFMLPVASSLGLISEVFALRTFVNWTPPTKIGPMEVLGVEIPTGVGYGAVFFRPSMHSLAKLPDDTVELDVGVEIRTDLGRRVTLFTGGISFFVSAAVDGDSAQVAQRAG